MEVDVVIEVPQGSRNKYEMDPVSGRIRLDRMLFTSTRYPADYGFIPGTLAEDGDPVDVMVLLGEPGFPRLRGHRPPGRGVLADRREGPGREGAGRARP